MSWLREILDFFLHVDAHIAAVIRDFGSWTYGILFLIIFCETGLVITPFLPGDSLLFAVGLFSNRGDEGLNLAIVLPLLVGACVIGDNVNYQIGRRFGHRAFRSESARFLKPSNLKKTHEFFEHYGPRTIIIARFVPIVRTFAPFVAGMGAMSFRKFLLYSVVAAVIWVGVCVLAGYFFGKIPWVRDNFSIAVLILIAASLIPPILEYLRARRKLKANRKPEPEPALAEDAREQQAWAGIPLTC